MPRRDPDLRLDFPRDWSRDRCDNYGRTSEATWSLFTVHPELGEMSHSHVYLRRDELLREYETFGSYPLIARPR